MRLQRAAVRTDETVGTCLEMSMCEPGVTNTKTSHDHLSVSGPLCGGTPFVDGGINQGQLIVGSPAIVPAGLPRPTDCSEDRWIRLFIGKEFHMGWDPPE